MDANMSQSTFSFSEDDVAVKSPANKVPDLAVLPEYWTKHETPTGCTYFVNDETKVITWIDPRMILKPS
jgi:hypothetical protein